MIALDGFLDGSFFEKPVFIGLLNPPSPPYQGGMKCAHSYQGDKILAKSSMGMKSSFCARPYQGDRILAKSNMGMKSSFCAYPYQGGGVGKLGQLQSSK